MVISQHQRHTFQVMDRMRATRSRRTVALTLGSSLFVLAINAHAQAPGVSCQNEWAPMRDGVLLRTEVYLPAAPGRHPVISVINKQALDLRFFEHYLKGVNNGIDRKPESAGLNVSPGTL
jgi:predicted acyl esterase